LKRASDSDRAVNWFTLVSPGVATVSVSARDTSITPATHHNVSMMREKQIDLLAYSLRNGFKRGQGPRPPCKTFGPMWPPTAGSKVNVAGILAMCICERHVMSIVCNFTLVLLVSLIEFCYYRLLSMHVLCIFDNLTLGIRTKDLHSIVRIRRPVVVRIEFPRPKTMTPHWPPKLKVLEPQLTYSRSCIASNLQQTRY